MNKKKIIVGMIHGVFDIIHYGHILYFKEAKTKVDHLIVSVTSDRFAGKGPGKPIFKLDKRIEVLKSIKYIDKIIISDNKTAVKNLKIVKPDFYIKGKDYKNLKDDLSGQILIEKKTVEKYGGKILFTKSELHSSSAIANDVFEYINNDIKKILNKIDKNQFQQKLFKFFKTKSEKKILIIGESIIDILRFIEVSGKANKSNIISTKFIEEEENSGGILLIANFLNLFFKNITLLYCGTYEDLIKIKKFLNKNIKIEYLQTKNKLIKKIRYIDKYSSQKIFQNNHNESDKLTITDESKVINKINKIKNKFDEILLFDYGYIYSSEKLFKSIKNKISKKITINCQSNSYNFGYNLADKFKSGKIISMDENEFRLIVRNREGKLINILKEKKEIFNKFKYLIVTQGKNGCLLKKNNDIIHVPCVLKPAIDSTGAGDIFLSTFFALELSKAFSSYELLIISHIAAGLHCNQIGNRFNMSIIDIYRIASSIIK